MKTSVKVMNTHVAMRLGMVVVGQYFRMRTGCSTDVIYIMGVEHFTALTDQGGQQGREFKVREHNLEADVQVITDITITEGKQA